ncbi:MAG: methylenetetrahydrofolate reductase C-terminal domain-containing protein [Solirubrobacterales bacterium]
MRPSGSGERTAQAKPSLRHLLTETDRFVTAVELVTSRGLITETKPQRVLALARELARHPRIDVLSMTDNPAGNAMLAADTLGTDLVSRGQEVIIHLSCKDWNRNAIQSRAWKLASEGFHNILALSGDAPSGGYRGVAASVFDIDSVGLLRMYTDMNAGTVLHGRTETEVQRTRFFLGAVVTNHKANENEVMPQLLKLRKKIDNGARFVINQIGYNARKDHELLQWLRAERLDVPVLANVFVLSPGAARAFHAGRVPGVTVSDALAEIVAREARSPDGGRAFFHDLAARQVAIARGLGFRGAYLGGHLEAEDYLAILDAADAYAGAWPDLAREIQFDLPGEWYLYERDPATGLAAGELNREYVASRRKAARRPRGRGVPARYRLARAMHTAVFAEDAPLFEPGRRFYERVEAAPKVVGRALHLAEQTVKVPMFDCRDCGDCSLPDIAYLCPESQCAKNQRNGPCGGTREDSKCEVGEKTCIWALAYDRLKAYGEELTMLDGPVVIKDNALAGTSAWANTFRGRDHHARPNPAQPARPDRPPG